MASDDTLNPREIALLEAYRGPGSGAEAAAQAGYRGNRATLAVRASKVLGKPAAQAWLAARKADRTRPDASSAEGDGPDINDATPVEMLREVMNDDTQLASSRVRAAELLLRREDAAKPADVDPFEALRATTAEQTRGILARERETGECARCHQLLPRSDR